MKYLLTPFLFLISFVSLAQPSYINLDVFFDENPEEISWQIDILTPQQDTIPVFNSPSYDNPEFVLGASSETIELETSNPQGNPINYLLTIYDSAGNGLCCDNGGGFIAVGNECQGLIIFDFTFSTSQIFYPFTLEPCELPPPPIEGCTDPEADNFNEEANIEDGSCEYTYGCTDPNALNYDPVAGVLPNGPIVPGGNCNLNSWNSNYFGIDSQDYNADPSLWETGTSIYISGQQWFVDDVVFPGNCNAPAVLIYVVTTIEEADGNWGTYTPGLNVNAVVGQNWESGGICEYPLLGCTDPEAINFNPDATDDDGSCIESCEGVQNLTGGITCNEWSPNQGQVEVSWDPTPPYCNPVGFHVGLNLDDLQFIPYGPWFGNYFYGSTESTPVSTDEYYFIIESPGGVLDTLILDNPNCGVGCTDPAASNYNPFAGVENFFNPSCEYGYVSECGTDNTQNIYVSITGDTFSQWETSWEILTVDSVPQVLASEDVGFYTTAGVTVTSEYCIPLGVEFTFNIYDSYGDGLAGSTTGGSADGDVLITTECGDTIYTILPLEGQNPNFGYGATSVTNLLNPCPPDNPPFGCKDPDYLEFNSLAENNDQSMCLTLAVPGCTDPNMFNYDPEANTMDLIPSCDYTLMLFDGGGDGWDNSYLGVVQDGEPIGAFTCTGQEALYTINISALTHIEFTFYEISFGGFFGEGGTTTDVSQCGFKLINSNGQIVYQKGDNPWLNPIESGQTYTPYLNCGNYCIPYIEGCIDEEAYNFNEEANTEDESCVYSPGCTNPLYLEYFEQGFEADVDNGSCNTEVINGCTDPEAYNFDPEANLDNDGCIPVLLGCTDEEAYNFDPNANTDNESCEPFIFGCTDPTAFNYSEEANADDNSCIPVIFGCTDETSYNYDPLANTNNDSCIPIIYGCTDDTAYNYDVEANTDDNSCEAIVEGCTQSNQFNYNPDANTDDGSCYPFVYGCLNPNSYTYNDYDNDGVGNPLTGIDGVDVNTNNNLCEPFIYGCLDETAFNYNPDANTEDVNNPCEPFVYGCMDPTQFNYDVNVNTDDGSCIEFVYGCTDEEAFNYDPLANTNVGCESIIQGCTDVEAYNFNPSANTDDGTCEDIVFGCTDETAFNYDPLANTNVGCESLVYGCTDIEAFNYNPQANTDNNSCIEIVYGCTDSSAFNYNPNANTNNGSCESIVFGCIDETALNYDPLANTDNSSCIPFIYGCTDASATNYDELANTEDGSCIATVYGCTDEDALNYNELANTDNGSCIEFIYGCTNPIALNYNELANTDDFSCVLPIYGCTDELALNYDINANVDNGTCIDVVEGCTNPLALNYNELANTDDFSCILPIYGCTDELALNYDENANVDNGTCIEIIEGCTDPNALNYNELANVDDFSCILPIYGCTDPLAFNYNELANIDNGSCEDIVEGCTDPSAFNYNPDANTEDFSCIDVIYGCTDPEAANYDELANTDNGSCETVYVNCIDPIIEIYNLLDLGNECFAWVIDVSPSCCSSEWTDGCQELYNYCDLNNETVNINEFGETQIIVFPNPTRDAINIVSTLQVNAVLYNSIGQSVLQETNVNRLDLNRFESGVYNLILTHGDLKFTKKIIKQ